MRHESGVRKLLIKVIRPSSPEDTAQDSVSDYRHRIPEALLTQEMKSQGDQALILDADQYSELSKVFRELRRHQHTEYLNDEQLWEKLWFLVCKAHLARDLYRRNTQMLKEEVAQFVSDLCKPLHDYELLFVVQHFALNGQSLTFWDCELKQLTADQLIRWGVNPDQCPFYAQALEEFRDQTVLVLEERGNNRQLIAQRARQRALLLLRGLQVSLSASSLWIHEQQLLFGLGEWCLSRKAGDPDAVFWHVRSHREPYGLTFDQNIGAVLGAAHEKLTRVREFSSEMRGTIELALYWIGRSIEEEELDQKVIALSAAMESLLARRDDKRKGEAVAYRMVLLAEANKKPFVDPAGVLQSYGARSVVAHGSGLGVTTKEDCSLMRTAAIDSFNSFIDIVIRENLTKKSRLIQSLEQSEHAKRLLDWLDVRESSPPLFEIRKALKEAISGPE